MSLRLFLAPSKCDFPVRATLHLDEGARVAAELRMTRLDQVLPHDGKLQFRGGAPAKPNIRSRGAPDLVGRQGADLTNRLGKLELSGQVQERLDHHLVVRAWPLRRTHGA